MKNSIIEEKVRVQRVLSKKSGSIAAYLKLAKEKAAETEKRFGVKLIRSAPAEKISGSEAAA
jgi:ureidoglycolate hydrolase